MVPPGAPLASGGTRLPAPPPPSEQIGCAAVGTDVKSPSLATIPEAVSSEFEPESALEVEFDSPLVIDYDRLFCASSNPEYAEYRNAWRLAQDEYHSSPATPRSLLSSPNLTATHAPAATTTVLELLVTQSRSRSRTGFSTPCAVPVEMGVLLLPPSIEADAVQADATAAARHVELRRHRGSGYIRSPAAAPGVIDWAVLSVSLALLEAQQVVDTQ